jgi:predicted nucleic acid-binding protein
MGEEKSGKRNFVDTNVLLYAIQAHPQFGETSKEILKRIDAGEKAVISSINLAEVCWWLEKHEKEELIEDELGLITSILDLEVAPLVLEDFLLAGKFIHQYKIDFNDCLVLASMKRLGITRIYSNDSDFDLVEWLKRDFK